MADERAHDERDAERGGPGPGFGTPGARRSRCPATSRWAERQGDPLLGVAEDTGAGHARDHPLDGPAPGPVVGSQAGAARAAETRERDRRPPLARRASHGPAMPATGEYQGQIPESSRTSRAGGSTRPSRGHRETGAIRQPQGVSARAAKALTPNASAASWSATFSTPGSSQGRLSAKRRPDPSRPSAAGRGRPAPPAATSVASRPPVGLVQAATATGSTSSGQDAGHAVTHPPRGEGEPGQRGVPAQQRPVADARRSYTKGFQRKRCSRRPRQRPASAGAPEQAAPPDQQRHESTTFWSRSPGTTWVGERRPARRSARRGAPTRRVRARPPSTAGRARTPCRRAARSHARTSNGPSTSRASSVAQAQSPAAAATRSRRTVGSRRLRRTGTPTSTSVTQSVAVGIGQREVEAVDRPVHRDVDDVQPGRHREAHLVAGWCAGRRTTRDARVVADPGDPPAPSGSGSLAAGRWPHRRAPGGCTGGCRPGLRPPAGSTKRGIGEPPLRRPDDPQPRARHVEHRTSRGASPMTSDTRARLPNRGLMTPAGTCES